MTALQSFGTGLAVAASITAAVYLRRIDARLATAQAAPVCTLTDLAGPEMAAAYQTMANKLTGRK